MRVLFVCNMNNHFFSVVRHLRDIGIDAHLLILKGESLHFHPSYDTFDLNYQTYTRTAPWGDALLHDVVAPSEIRKDLSRFPFIVTSGTAPGFLHRAGISSDLFVPHGSDLTEMPFFRLSSPDPRAPGSALSFPLAQRRGIQEALAHGGAYTPQFEDTLAQLHIRGRRIVFPMIPVYANHFNAERIREFYPLSSWYQDFQAIRDSSDVVIFHHARHIWKSPSVPLGYKGNDKLIRGFAAAVKANPDVRMSLIALEYGPDVSASKELVSECGIEKNVHFFPLMARKELFVGISLSDIVCGEFSVSWNFGGTIIEGIAMGKPLLHHRDDAKYPASELFPIMNVSSADDIARSLNDYVVRPAHYNALGAEAYKWFNTNIVTRSLDGFRELLWS